MKKLFLTLSILFCLAGGVVIAQATYCTPTENGGESCYTADDAYKAGYRYGYNYVNYFAEDTSQYSLNKWKRMCPSEYSYYATDWASGATAGAKDKKAKKDPRY